MRLRNRIAAASLAVLFLATSNATAASAATVKNITPDRIFQFDHPVSDNAIQAFDNGAGTDVFFTQRINKDTRLSRCSRTAAGTCSQKDSVILPGYGHGESLEVFTEGSKTYAWVGSSAAAASPYFSREVSLVEYIKPTAGNKYAGYRRVGTLTNLAAVQPGKTGAGVRSAVALADGADRLGLRVQTGATGGESYYGIFKTAALTARMKAAPGQRLSIASAKDLMVSKFKEPKRPHGSFQGFDIKGVGAGGKYLYVFGGGAGQAPTIYRFSYTNGGNTTHDRTYVIKGAYIGALEAEGVKVEKDPTSGGKERVQISLNPTKKDSAGRKMFRTYKFAE